MLDYRALLADAAPFVEKLSTRGVSEEQVRALQDMVRSRSEAIQQTEALRQQLNSATKEVQTLRGKDDEAFEAARAKLKTLKDSIKTSEAAQVNAEEQLNTLLLTVPNLPDDSVPVGPDESANELVRTVGEPKPLGFDAKPHWELGETLGILDFERASKLSGARFSLYRGAGARLELALANFMLDVAQENGFVPVIPPVLVRSEAMVASGQYPKFKGESFETTDEEFTLIPTSEVSLVNLHRDEILDEASLPIRYTAFTPCFRKEAGAAGRDTRGLIRLHQFNKVELVSITRAEDSFDELERITANGESILQKLELPYRVMALCTGDMGFAAAKTYDLEVWLPGQGAYREISSCSNCTDFQARRAKIRYRSEDGSKKKKTNLAHTLNGSGLAVGRTFVAVLENYQREDGSVAIPAALQPYLGGMTEIVRP
ncbi:MAG: serine--tRNA ligase [Myxococcota bacterium]